MRNNDSNTFVTVDSAVASACVSTGRLDAPLCPANLSDPTEEGCRSLSILTQVGRPTVAKHHARAPRWPCMMRRIPRFRPSTAWSVTAAESGAASVDAFSR